MSFKPKIVNSNYTALFDAKGVEGDNNSVTWELKKTVEDLTIEEVRVLPGINPNFQRARDVKRLMQKGFTCTQIVQALRSKYSERAVKGDHAALNKIKNKKK